MRADTQVGGKPVLAVVLSDVSTSLTFPVSRIRLAIERGNVGHNRITKDFLIPGKNSDRVTRNVNSHRKKCETFTLSKLERSDMLKAGECP
jgi:hypothetical protein